MLDPIISGWNKQIRMFLWGLDSQVLNWCHCTLRFRTIPGIFKCMVRFCGSMLGFAPRPVRVVKDLPFGSITASYQPLCWDIDQGNGQHVAAGGKLFSDREDVFWRPLKGVLQLQHLFLGLFNSWEIISLKWAPWFPKKVLELKTRPKISYDFMIKPS